MAARKPVKTTKTRITSRTKSTNSEAMAVIPEQKQSNMSVRLSRSKVSIILLVVILIVLAYIFKGFFVVATVNGEPISRLALIQELEQQGGKQTLSSLITKSLIQQEARNRNIVVTDQDVNTEIKKIEDSVSKQGQKLDDLLAAQNRTRASLIDQIKLQKMLDKMVGKNVTVTDKEVSDYLEQNKSLYPEGTDLNSMKPQIKAQLLQKKMGDKVQAFIDTLQKKAKITYFVNY